MSTAQRANANASELLAETLRRIQIDQHRHDEVYHREISRLPLQDRLRHMTLHFAKYAGRLHEQLDEAELQKLAVDVFIIAVSTANSLNLDLVSALAQAVGPNEQDLTTLGELLLRRRQGGKISQEQFARELSIAAGKMSAACEKLDHLEAYPFREVITQSVVAIFLLAVEYIGAMGWNHEFAVRSRLRRVKERYFLHGYI